GPLQARVAVDEHLREAAVGKRHDRLARSERGDLADRVRPVLLARELVADELLGLEHVGRDDVGLRPDGLARKSSTSRSVTAGPRSLISVCSPVVGSSTEVFVRDSSRMRTKSLRIDSSVSCSTMCVPVAPPAKPVAITGWPSSFSVRAMFTPLPPAVVRCSTVRWRRPSWKLGTESDLSIAALSVTVMIMWLHYSLPAH